MVICHCLVISDRAINELAADPSTTVDDIVASCGAGGQCGGCRPSIELVLRRARSEAGEGTGVPSAA